MPDEKPIDAGAPATGDQVTPDSTDAVGAPGESQGAKETERTDWKGLYLTAKGKVERVNDLERENQEMRARLATPPTQTGSIQEDIAQRTYQELQALADRDPAARAALMIMQQQATDARRYQAEIELSRLPESERDGVTRYLQSGDYRNVNSARKAWLGDQLETREKEREAQSQRERERREAEKAKNSSPDTATRTVTAPGNSGGMKESEWIAELKTAREKGDFVRLKELRSPKVEGNLVPG